MITAIIINIFLLVFSTIFSWLPDALVLPTIGGVDLDYYISSGMGYFKFLTTIFPPLAIVASASVIYLTWKLIIIGVKMVLGHRTPVIKE